MTDKQIITDGVDVSGCKYYLFREQQPNGERCCGMGLVDCNGNDCLYKKYKRKEQECETLASQLDFEVQKKECLEQECKELKRQHQADKGLITSTGKQNYQLIQEYDKLKNCLTEIKEIAESDNHYCSDGTILRYEVVNKILQKISECEGNDDSSNR